MHPLLRHAAEKIFGYTGAEAIGRHISLIIPPECMDEENHTLGKIMKGERVEHFEAQRRTKNGQLRSFSITVSPIRNMAGQVIGASKIARDITAHKEAERTNAYMGSIIESSDDAIISKNLNGVLISWNPGAERLFGYTAEEAIGKHISLIIPPERLFEEDKIIAMLKAGQRLDHFETMRRRKNGTLVPVAITVSPIRLNGVIIGASKIARDISDRLAAEKAMQELSRKKDEFLATVSHELRTPMNAVIGLSSLLKTSPTLSPQDRKFVDTLKSSADSLLELINDLLDFSKIESGGMELEETEFNLAEQLEHVISVMHVKAKEKKLELRIRHDETLSRYYIGDAMRIQQVLMNLVSNAVKFTSHGGVEVTLSGDVDELRSITRFIIHVSDTGIGISPEKQQAIFEKFTQGDNSVSRRYGGSGLGLSITKALVEKMGGSISVSSELGMGSTFEVRLTLKNSARQSSIQSFSASAASAPEPQHKHVLLVEDYGPNVLVASTMLETLGYAFDVASNGLEAIRKFMQSTYDVVLMDVQMHELDGLQATRKIRKLEAEKGLPHTPIIAMTAHVREQEKNQCLEAGMDDFLLKPFEIADLSQKINKYRAHMESPGLNLLAGNSEN
ncbi:MAG: PAS domain S-box protein [Proteobacteria bacterium]|nr:PAS domain S-box protein [Pseudomonadota bacterium]